MKSIFLTFLLSIILQNVNAQIDRNLSLQLQNELINAVLSGNNGVSAYLIMPDGETWSGTAGIGAQNLSIEENTVFHGASTTKFNIALLIVKLSEAGLLDLDESWSNYVTINADFDPAITVRQLLNHTSGIADYLEGPGSYNDITADFNYFFSPEYILEEVVSDAPIFPPGTDFQYSNSNYVLAGLIAEAVTGNQVHEELKTRIWEPLGMDHTYFGAYDNYFEPSAGIWWDFGGGLTNYSDEPTTSMLSYAYGAGNIVTCPRDLAILTNAFFEDQIVSPASKEEMLTFVPASFYGWTAGYGLGIHHAYGYSEDILLGHDGYYTNMTDMFYSSNYGFTLVTMTNTQTSWFGIFNPMYDIMEEYFTTIEIQEANKEFDILLYPNPCKGKLHISSNTIIQDLMINDMAGKLIFKSKPNKKMTAAEIFETGIYLIKVQTIEGCITRKIVISR